MEWSWFSWERQSAVFCTMGSRLWCSFCTANILTTDNGPLSVLSFRRFVGVVYLCVLCKVRQSRNRGRAENFLNNGCPRINEPLSILEISLTDFDIYTWMFLQKIAREILFKILMKRALLTSNYEIIYDQQFNASKRCETLLWSKFPVFSDVLFLPEVEREYLDTTVRFQRQLFVENESKPSIVLVIHATRCRKNTLQHSVCIEMIEKIFFFDFIINLNI
jgi:hypothetical protein